ncbi:MAG: hypothetical protein GY708_11335 [Actinomycetia bacterium]|nr:hypothetical protein [Actinomycetes bacterium]MCP4962485.1 hypothetical protein [Actinomycetes bacterium]
MSVGDNPDGEFAVVRSADGVHWTENGGGLTGLPEALAGPYRIWPFGDGFMLYGSSGFEDPELLGEDPFVAISDDLLTWEEIELPGMDQLFFNGWQNAHGPGDVSADGQVALFSGSNRAFESGVGGLVLWVVRPGRAPVLLDNDEGVYAFTFLQGMPIGLTWLQGGAPQLYLLDDVTWMPLPSPPANPQLGPAVRAVGSALFLLSSGESWSTNDVGATWSQIPTMPSSVRSSGYFGAFTVGGPAEPPFGAPDSFRVSTDGIGWTSSALPEGATGIRHLASNEAGLLSVVEFGKPQQRFETLFTPR